MMHVSRAKVKDKITVYIYIYVNSSREDTLESVETYIISGTLLNSQIRTEYQSIQVICGELFFRAMPPSCNKLFSGAHLLFYTQWA